MRLFIAIVPNEQAACALEETARRLQAFIPARYVPRAQYHLTLAFLGDVPQDRLKAVRSAMEDAARSALPFTLRLDAVGRFGPVLWRGVAKSPALDRLARSLRNALRARRLPVETRPFRAHLTLARDARLPNASATHFGFSFDGFADAACAERGPGAAFTVRSIILLESTRADGALRYLPRVEVDF